jgi:DNA-binding beta-propeller fold protein YncE
MMFNGRRRALTGGIETARVNGVGSNVRSSFLVNGDARLCLLVCALGTLLASSALSQLLEGSILLPDSLGPLTGANHVVFDEDSAHPRIFIGGEGGDVIVADAITCERAARILTGPMKALCYAPAHNKLYVSTTDEYGVVVVDCGSYEVIKRLPIPYLVTGLCYNPLVDRVYCAAEQMQVIDCASDRILGPILVNGRDANLALDVARNKLYLGAKDALKVINCNRNSVHANIDELRGSQAICFQPSAGKVYVAAGESLFALNTESDTVIYRRRYDTLNALLACDAVHNRLYYTYCGKAIALDCSSDSVIWSRDLWARAVSLATAPTQDRLYVMLNGLDCSYKYILDGATGQTLLRFPFSYRQDNALHYCAAARRAVVVWDGRQVTAFDCDGDTLVGVTPLATCVAGVCVDTVDNKLYFSSGTVGVGIVDCSTNMVKSYVRPCEFAEYGTQAFTHDSRDRKLYFSADSVIFVLDCATDSVVRAIPAGGLVQTLDWYPDLNKLYAVVIRDTCTSVVVVVDCSCDRVAKVVGLNPAGRWDSRLALLAPEFDQLWVFSCSQWYAVFDCRGDSIVEDTIIQMANYSSASYSPTDHRVYAAHNRGLSVMDTDNRLPVGSPFPGVWSPQVHCATESRKAYWIMVQSAFPFVESVAVVDTRTDSITSTLAVPYLSEAACDDCTGDYVYIAGDNFTSAGGFIFVVDTRTDSIVSSAGIPVATRFFVRNGRTNHLYAAGLADSVIQVVYDSVIFAGLQTESVGQAPVAQLQTVVRSGTALRSPTEAGIYDASGRRAAALKAGPNDISHLAPGVYFVCEKPQASSFKPQAVRKIILTE